MFECIWIKKYWNLYDLNVNVHTYKIPARFRETGRFSVILKYLCLLLEGREVLCPMQSEWSKMNIFLTKIGLNVPKCQI